MIFNYSAIPMKIYDRMAREGCFDDVIVYDDRMLATMQTYGHRNRKPGPRLRHYPLKKANQCLAARKAGSN